MKQSGKTLQPAGFGSSPATSATKESPRGGVQDVLRQIADELSESAGAMANLKDALSPILENYDMPELAGYPQFSTTLPNSLANIKMEIMRQRFEIDQIIAHLSI